MDRVLKMNVSYVTQVFLCLLTPLISVAIEQAPLRNKFPDVKVVLIKELNRSFNDVVIVDARTRFEYDTIHINGAINLSIADYNFISQLESAVPDKKTTVVFYCNGYTCSKSYRSARKAMKVGGYHNALALDAGVFLWGRAHPEKTTLLGKTPLETKRLIPAAEFASHLLSYKEFKSRALNKNSIVIDIRDAQQRRSSDGTILRLPDMPKLPKNRNLKMNFNLARKNLNDKRFIDREILIYDAAGIQVKWLHYILKSNGYKNFFFLKGGVYGVTNLVHI